jgi:hypothetical protein
VPVPSYIAKLKLTSKNIDQLFMGACIFKIEIDLKPIQIFLRFFMQFEKIPAKDTFTVFMIKI